MPANDVDEDGNGTFFHLPRFFSLELSHALFLTGHG